jgi:alkylhydroperoxidase family enzyme
MAPEQRNCKFSQAAKLAPVSRHSRVRHRLVSEDLRRARLVVHSSFHGPTVPGSATTILMPRLRQVPRSETDDAFVLSMYDFLFDDRDPVSDPGTSTGTPGDWWTTFALVPDVLKHCVRGFALYRSPERVISPALRELAQARAGWSSECQFVYSQHLKSGRGIGLSEEKLAGIAAWQVADCFDETERAVLAYTDGLVQGGRVADGVFETLRHFLSDEEILELTYITAMYIMHAIMTRALRLELDDIPERMVEAFGPYPATSNVIEPE